MTKSTKRSAARTRQRRHSPPTLYIDECLGRGIALRLQLEGHDASPFDEFAGRSDVEFLPVIGERQWVLVTKDKNVRRNQLEVHAILNAGVRAFVITASGLDHQQISDLVLRAMPKIVRVCRQRGPFVYNVTATGAISQIPRRTLERRARGKKI